MIDSLALPYERYEMSTFSVCYVLERSLVSFLSICALLIHVCVDSSVNESLARFCIPYIMLPPKFAVPKQIVRCWCLDLALACSSTATVNCLGSCDSCHPCYAPKLHTQIMCT